MRKQMVKAIGGGGGGGGAKIDSWYFYISWKKIQFKESSFLQNRKILKTREITVIYFFGVFLILIGEYRKVKGFFGGGR